MRFEAAEKLARTAAWSEQRRLRQLFLDIFSALRDLIADTFAAERSLAELLEAANVRVEVLTVIKNDL